MTSATRRTVLWGVLFPPAGLFFVWRRPGPSLLRRLLATVGLLFYSVIYAMVIVAWLHFSFGLTYEFRGGYIPRLTFRKTVPDYDVLEQSRAVQAPAKQSLQPGSLPAQSFWNGFRGPRRDGHYDEAGVRTNWPPEGLRPLWRQPCGGGYASFAIAGEVAFTIEQRREDETVVAYDLGSGAELWTHSWPALFSEPLGGDGPRATPAYDGGRLYALGARGEFRCLEGSSGKELWRRNIVEDTGAPLLTYGMAASPLIVGSTVIVAAGGRPNGSVVAYDKNTGERVWAALDDRAAYSSPMLVTLAGVRQLLVATRDRVLGLNPEGGALLWEFPWVVLHNNRNIAQPLIVGTSRVFLSAGYGTGCALIEVAPTNSAWSVRELWRNKNLKNKFTSSVLWQGYIYGLDEDILTCLDTATGRRVWKEGRYGYGQLLLASGQLLILTGTGDVAVVRASPERHEELARFPAIRGKTWNHPALSSGRLLVRNSAEIACFNFQPQ